MAWVSDGLSVTALHCSVFVFFQQEKSQQNDQISPYYKEDERSSNFDTNFFVPISVRRLGIKRERDNVTKIVFFTASLKVKQEFRYLI